MLINTYLHRAIWQNRSFANSTLFSHKLGSEWIVGLFWHRGMLVKWTIDLTVLRQGRDQVFEFPPEFRGQFSDIQTHQISFVYFFCVYPNLICGANHSNLLRSLPVSFVSVHFR